MNNTGDVWTFNKNESTQSLMGFVCKLIYLTNRNKIKIKKKQLQQMIYSKPK